MDKQVARKATVQSVIQRINEIRDEMELAYDKERYVKVIKELQRFLEIKELSDAKIAEIKELRSVYKTALSLQIPVSGITVLGGKLYINTIGLLNKTFQVAKNHNGVKRIEAYPLEQKGEKFVSLEVEAPAFFVGIVEFGDGSIFKDIGEASATNIRMSSIRPFLNSMAARRATNRAMRLATGIGLTSVEEIENGGEVIPEEVKMDVLTTKEMQQIAELLQEIGQAKDLKELNKIKQKISGLKDKLNEQQLRFLGKAFRNKEIEYGVF